MSKIRITVLENEILESLMRSLHKKSSIAKARPGCADEGDRHRHVVEIDGHVIIDVTAIADHLRPLIEAEQGMQFIVKRGTPYELLTSAQQMEKEVGLLKAEAPTIEGTLGNPETKQ